jgi:hypothetical protein
VLRSIEKTEKSAKSGGWGWWGTTGMFLVKTSVAKKEVRCREAATSSFLFKVRDEVFPHFMQSP